MKQTIIFFVAFALLGIGLTSFINFDGSVEKETKSFKTSTILIDEPSVNVLERDYYDDYLEELAVPGPKSEVIVKSNEFQTTIVESTKENSINESIEVKEPVSIKEEPAEKVEKVKDNIGVVDHTPFGALLKKHVNSKGDVNYAAFKKDEAALDAYLEQLKSNPVDRNMSKNERLAYWINVYNAFTIKLILDNYPLNSIMDLEGGKPWDKVFITLGNTSYSLNMVENEVIRKRFTEPRIHFAVNCAAASCPPLLNDAFYPDKLTNQLAERTSSFINNSSYNTITSSKLQVSKIFDWYGSDFGDVKSYLNRNVDVDVSGLTLEFKEYDWSLNKQ